MKMSSEFLASPGGRLTQRVSLGILVASATLFAACGGGGSSTPDETPPNVKILSAVKITAVTIGSVPIDGTTVTPDEPAVVSVSYDAGGVQGAGTVSVTCASVPASTQAAGTTSSKLDFTHNPWAVGSCVGTVTVSATGYASATSNFAFTVKKASPLTYNTTLFVAGDTCKNVGMLTVVGQTMKETLFVNKTVYQDQSVACKLFQGAIAYQGDAVYKAVDGSLVLSYQTPGAVGGNQRRYFVANPVTGEVGKEVQAPAGITLRDVPYGTFGNTPYVAQGISNVGMYASTSLGLIYFTDADAQHARLAPSGNFATSYMVGSTGYQLMVAVSN